MPKKIWTRDDIPSQTGKLAIVTGAGTTTGLGFQISLVLAKSGATVILAGRNEEKGQETIQRLLSFWPEAKLEFGVVDLCSLASVSEFARKISEKYDHLDILINNAGVGPPETRRTTSDGFEIVFGTNHLSHFALTAKLLPLLRKSPCPRVVAVSSGIYKQGKINFEDLQSEKISPYGMNVYAQSKLANLLFAKELQRKSEAGNWGITSMATNPGFSRTGAVAKMKGALGWITNDILQPIASHSAAEGALPTLFAATSPDAKGGAYYAPDGWFEMKGNGTEVQVTPAAMDTKVAARLWEVSTELTGVTWD